MTYYKTWYTDIASADLPGTPGLRYFQLNQNIRDHAQDILCYASTGVCYFTWQWTVIVTAYEERYISETFGFPMEYNFGRVIRGISEGEDVPNDTYWQQKVPLIWTHQTAPYILTAMLESSTGNCVLGAYPPMAVWDEKQAFSVKEMMTRSNVVAISTKPEVDYVLRITVGFDEMNYHADLSSFY